LLKLLSDQNICSRDWVIRQYDHEVRANTVIKPLHGKTGHWTHGDAAVLKPVEESFRGLAIATASNPFAVAGDPYRGGKTCVDEVCRNIAAVGARPHSLTDCLNFGNPEKPDRLWQFREAVRGIGEVAKDLDLPIPSGNVSFYNESPRGSVLPTPAILGCGIVRDIRKCITSDFKREGDPIFLVGETGTEMGASAYYRSAGGHSSKVPDVETTALRAGMDIIIGGIERGVVVACHDISDGGLAVASAEMCIGGDVGANMSLEKLGRLRSDVKLFNESNSRWLIEVRKGKEKQLPKDRRTKVVKLGRVGGSSLVIGSGRRLVDLEVGRLAKSFGSPLWRIVG